MAVSIPFCLFLSAEIERTFLKIIFPILILAIVTTLLYYFSFGLLKVTSSDNQLNFRWNKKPIFNFKEYNSIEFNNIESIIVEQGIYLRKLKTQDAEIELGGMKSKNTDSLKLLTLLKTKTSIKPKDSWDVWNERGWLKIAYKINLLILIVATGIVITFIVLKGFDSKLLLFIPLVLSQLIFSHLQMKDKLK
ncbi:MAG: hypothetical protein Tsb0033_19230 [Winogradskyella sp.]